MTKRQRRKFEMFLKVRDFFNARAADFPADSIGGQLFAALLLIIQQLEQLGTDKISVTGDVAQFVDIKGDAKDLLYSLLQDISDMAATMAYEINGLEDKFRIPRNRSVQNLILTGRAFAADAGDYRADFTEYGLAPDFITQLTAATDALAAAYGETDESTQERVGTNAALVPLFKDGMVKVNRLQPIIRMKYRNNAANLSAWIYASHLEREPHPAPAPPAA
jgi:hypothetical protein